MISKAVHSKFCISQVIPVVNVCLISKRGHMNVKVVGAWRMYFVNE